MTTFFRKLSSVCIILAIVSIFTLTYVAPVLIDIPSSHLWFIDSEIVESFVRWFIFPLYLSFCPIIFIVLAVALRKISKEIEQVNINVLQQICELERQIEKLKNKS